MSFEDKYNVPLVLCCTFARRLADLAVFRVYAEKKLEMSGDNTWIVFGGSYAGSLSAWFRLKVDLFGSRFALFKLVNRGE